MTSLSIWEKESYYATQDVVIIGAGLMGLWTAFELKKRKPSLHITILERNSTPLGASTRNAGFACFGSPTELLYDTTTMGENEMCNLVEMRYKGIKKIRQYFSDNTIGFSACGGYECVNQIDENFDDRLQWLNKQLAAITNTSNCFSREDKLLSTFGLQGFDVLIENKLEGSLHSGYLTKALTQKVQELGVQILYGANVTAWNKQSNFTEVALTDKKIKTTSLLFCTNAFTNSLVKDANITPARGQVIVTSPIANLALKGTFHFDEGFYYWRNVGNRILLGGARNKDFTGEKTIDLSTSTIIQQELEQFLKVHLASQYEYIIEDRWSGIMAFSESKKPIIKAIDENVLIAMACNGMGVALTPIIAEDVAALVIEKFN